MSKRKAPERKASGRSKGGRPRTLGMRWPATIAVDLAAAYRISDVKAAIVAWQTLHELAPHQYGERVPELDLTSVMRAIRGGRAVRIEYSPFVLLEAAKRLPAGARPR